MKETFQAGVWTHPIVLSAIGLVVVIAFGSGGYYLIESRVPRIEPALAAASSTAELSDIAATGVVAPAESPDLSFVSGGRIVAVNVSVGQSVAPGQTLAALDTASLAAARDQAAANLRAQEARLDQLKAGPRASDLSQKQTAVAQAQLTLTNLYGSAAVDLGSQYSALMSALRTDADPLFTDADSSAPHLGFQTSNTQIEFAAESARVSAGAELMQWNRNASASAEDTVAIERALYAGEQHALAVRTLVNSLTSALSAAVPTTSIASAQASVSLFHATLETAITKLQSDSQAIANAKLALQSAQDALAQANAGATTQDIEAQSATVDAARASLNATNAALQNAMIVAPYSGTVSAVHVKRGDIIAPNTVAISLAPHAALQFEAYVSEVDAARVRAGAPVAVTLDAFGTAQTFAATIVSIDRSPTMQQGVPAYKAVAQFSRSEAALAPGMTGSLSIHLTP